MHGVERLARRDGEAHGVGEQVEQLDLVLPARVATADQHRPAGLDDPPDLPSRARQVGELVDNRRKPRCADGIVVERQPLDRAVGVRY